LPDVEYVCNQIAVSLSLPVAKFYCVEFLGERTFVTKNFVDKRRSTNLVHLYHLQPSKKPRDCETLINIISEETKRFVDVETFVNTCLFDGLIGNHDRHGRNLGVLVTSRGSVLAPIYDNPSALGLEKGEWLKADFSPKGRIPTKDTHEPTIKHYVSDFMSLGYQDQVLRFQKRISQSKIENILDESFCSDLMKQALKRMISVRIKELDDAISKRS